MRWRVLAKLNSSSARSDNYQRIIEILLKNRGLKTKRQQEEFLNPPSLKSLTFKDLGISSIEVEKFLKRVKEAIRKKEKVVIYGDYDTDGVCATAILWETLFHQGAEVMPFIPKRSEGYGLRSKRLKEMAQNGVKLIITVDQGIVAYRQVETAKKLGIDLIITDHHLPGEKKPKALAIIHTTKLSGAGVAWFLARRLGDESGLDLAVISTITDVIPLVGPARVLVKEGLSFLRKTQRKGLLALFKQAGVEAEKIGVFEIGFIIGPRLNASGRMDDPMDSLRLICSRDSDRVDFLSQEIEKKNRQRQIVTEELTAHAKEEWLKTDGKSALIFIHNKNYEEGVIGLVASKLVQEFYRPAVVLAPREDSWVASARSIEEFNIIEAVRMCAEFLGPHGGHKKAAGFSVKEEKISLVRQKLIEIAENSLDKNKLKPTLTIDLELNLKDLGFDLYHQLEKLAPFGEGNPQPVFASQGVQIIDAQVLGSDNQHLKLRLKQDDFPFVFEAIAFGQGSLFSQLFPEQKIDIAYHLEKDEWNGRTKLKLRIRDIKFRENEKSLES